LNQYGIRKEKHFQASCDQCNGWGWVEKGSKDAACPGHEWEEVRVGDCLHRWTCKRCGESREVDSSG
jgi:hypothetical protein